MVCMKYRWREGLIELYLYPSLRPFIPKIKKYLTDNIVIANSIKFECDKTLPRDKLNETFLANDI